MSNAVSPRPILELSGSNHIDALLNTNASIWSAVAQKANILSFSFALRNAVDDEGVMFSTFSANQQKAAVHALQYISSVTGIKFQQVVDPRQADITFATQDISGEYTAGYCDTWWQYDDSMPLGMDPYVRKARVVLDTAEFAPYTTTGKMQAGGEGYEILLHELGHALGLKHPFSGTPVLPEDMDHTENSLMSYTDAGQPHSVFSPFDLAALNWLYGGDGLNGRLGFYGGNSTNKGAFLQGSAANDNLQTGTGNDVLEGKGGNDALIGGAGIDTARFDGPADRFKLAKNGGAISVADQGGTLGTDLLTGIERVQFTDRSIAFDVDGVAGKAYRLYQAAFDRTPDAGGLGFWINAMEKDGMSLAQVAQGFADSAEFGAMYGSKPSAANLVNTMYQHVLHRAPDSGGLDFWSKQLAQGMSVARVLESFSESAENQAQLIGKIQNGMEFIHIA